MGHIVDTYASFGFTLIDQTLPDMTHEKYFEDIEKWLAEREKEND